MMTIEVVSQITRNTTIKINKMDCLVLSLLAYSKGFRWQCALSYSNVFRGGSSTSCNPDEDGALSTGLKTKELVTDSTSVVATILKNEDNSLVSKVR